MLGKVMPVPIVVKIQTSQSPRMGLQGLNLNIITLKTQIKLNVAKEMALSHPSPW